jgi:hypothetical protein
LSSRLPRLAVGKRSEAEGPAVVLCLLTDAVCHEVIALITEVKPGRSATLSTRLTIALLLAFSSPLWGQASPNMAPGYQQTYDRLLQQIRQIAIFDDHGHPGFAEDS